MIVLWTFPLGHLALAAGMVGWNRGAAFSLYRVRIGRYGD